MTRAMNFMTRAVNFTTCAVNFTTRAVNFMTRAVNFMTRAVNFMTRAVNIWVVNRLSGLSAFYIFKLFRIKINYAKYSIYFETALLLTKIFLN